MSVHVSGYPSSATHSVGLNSCISLFTSLPAEGEYLRRDDDFFEEDFLPALLDFLVLELFFAELFLVLLFFALLFFVLDFFALLDLYSYAFERALYARGTTRLELIQELCRDGFPVPAPYGGLTA